MITGREWKKSRRGRREREEGGRREVRTVPILWTWIQLILSLKTEE